MLDLLCLMMFGEGISMGEKKEQYPKTPEICGVDFSFPRAMLYHPFPLGCIIAQAIFAGPYISGSLGSAESGWTLWS